MNRETPLVSLLIPAYNPRFFPLAFNSALSQTYPNLEIIVSDDSPDSTINEWLQTIKDKRVRYAKNEKNLGFAGNFTRCFELAGGTFIKYLNDDDMLHPECVARMVKAFNEYGQGVTLLCSKRQVVNEKCEPIDDLASTERLAWVDCRIRGEVLMNLALQNGTNLIGEPSTILFRKSDLELSPGNIFRFGQYNYEMLADMSLHLRLLTKGDAVYLATEYSAHRRHAGQLQLVPEIRATGIKDWCELAAEAQRRGLLESPEMRRKCYTSVLRTLDHILTLKTTQPWHEELKGIRADLLEKIRDTKTSRAKAVSHPGA